MQQTALNLIAIAIFLMTLSILLGPLVHIPESVPAIATFSILAFLTADRFGWEGKGLTLLLDTVSRFSPEHRDRVLRHEAGHFLAAYYLGIPVTGYDLTAWESLKNGQQGVGGVRFDTEELLQGKKAGDRQLFCDRFCTVWMAGIAAESLTYKTVEGGGSDRQKVTDTLAILGYPTRESRNKQQWGELQAKTLIEKHQTAYEALVKAMKIRTTVAECYQILEKERK
ncbi:ATP-dependent Zn protease [Spirulina sp. 06S082]|uniref:ATP-dependent Zn protease n=1 Tax=Spirulina sp. 06S082 TaxID=3110248 RepID=UPI002B1F1F1D|nr:ATP-dependent Zn protease [Spirulina sp. 06S082]MEA5471285.1 ATP-dependent Zn protease [Spirulina sp. 06S082]